MEWWRIAIVISRARVGLTELTFNKDLKQTGGEPCRYLGKENPRQKEQHMQVP